MKRGLPSAVRLRVAVAGGSLSGLTTAVLLADLGFDVHVFERSASELLGRGVGIVLHPITVRWLVEQRGVDLDVISTGTTSWVYVAADGSTLYSEACSYRFTAWNTLYRALRQCLHGDRYCLGHPLTGFHQSDRSVMAKFGERVVEVDLMVGADGTHSTVRSQLLPDSAPQYAGYVGWRGTIPEANLSQRCRSALGDSITYHMTGDSHVLVYPIPSVDGDVGVGQRLMNFVWYRNVSKGEPIESLMTDLSGARRDVSVPPGMVQHRHVAELHESAQRLPPAMAELVTRIPDPFVQQVVDLAVPTMAFGRICLLGDAACTVRPHAAAGTAKAAADAWALAQALTASNGQVEAALRAWQPGQLALASNLLLRSRRIGERYQLGTADPNDQLLRFGLREPGDSQIPPGPYARRPESPGPVELPPLL